MVLKCSFRFMGFQWLQKQKISRSMSLMFYDIKEGVFKADVRQEMVSFIKESARGNSLFQEAMFGLVRKKLA